MRDVVEDDTCPRCQKCDRWRGAPEYIREPMLLWERFPCPPPGTNRARLLIELDWTGQLGPRDGCKALRRVAARCKVDLSSVNIIPSSLNDCEELFTVFGICGTQCWIAIALACICLLFVFLLAIVCYRYVRRNDKDSSPTCTKVLNTDQSSLNTQVNRYYVQSQYIYRAGNIPDRRGLPFEARTLDNGVEARLIKAIQSPFHPPSDDVCSQCKCSSRQSTLSNGRGRHGYERIYWKDRDCIQNNISQKRVPSTDSLVHRKQLERHRSTAGSSSDMSHYYDYIGDYPYDSFSGRRSNHSTVYFPRNGSINLNDVPNNNGDARFSDDERGLYLPRMITQEFNLRDITPPRQEIVPSRASVDSRGYRCDKNSYQGSLSDHYNFTDSEHEPRAITDGLNVKRYHDDRNKNKSSKSLNTDIIKGYKYTFNPSFDDETTTTSRQEYSERSTSPETPSECVEFDIFANSSDNKIIPSPNVIRTKRPNTRTSSLRSLKHSETTSLSDNSSKSTNSSSPKISGKSYK